MSTKVVCDSAQRDFVLRICHHAGHVTEIARLKKELETVTAQRDHLARRAGKSLLTCENCKKWGYFTHHTDEKAPDGISLEAILSCDSSCDEDCEGVFEDAFLYKCGNEDCDAVICPSCFNDCHWDHVFHYAAGLDSYCSDCAWKYQGCSHLGCRQWCVNSVYKCECGKTICTPHREEHSWSCEKTIS